MLTASHLRKQYTTVLAVDDVSLEVKRGGIFGLLGPNGAGKTTTIRMLLNIIAPDSGSVTYDGEPFSPSLQDRIGYLPEERGLYRKNKLLDTILYFSSLKGINGSQAKRTALNWLDRFDLRPYAGKKIEELSKGNQQKVQFIVAVMHGPDFVVLDEPFAGLDPVNQIILKDILQELKQQGKAIIFSTHQMDSAEKLCDEICVINHGRIVLEGSVKEVRRRFGRDSVRLEYQGNGAFLSSLPFVRQATVYENSAEIVLDHGPSAKEILDAVVPNLEVRKFEFVEPSLNSIFLDVVGASQPVQEKPELTAPVRIMPTQARSKRERQAMLGMIIAGVVTVVLLVANLKKDRPDWSMTLLMAAATLVSLVQYVRARKESERNARLAPAKEEER